MPFSASLSGLNANQQKLNVIGNNLANINTIAFKASNLTFADLVNQTVGGTGANPMQVGLGVTTGAISPNFGQGGIESTGVATNVAIQGNGFFVVGDQTSRSYTRAGDFSFDENGMLVTATGQPVLGYTQLDPDTGDVLATGQPTSIVVPPGALRDPIPTTAFSIVSNLDARAGLNDAFTASVQIVDALGMSHVATVTYTNTAPGAWTYTMTVPGEEVTGGTAGTPSQVATGTLTFDASGRLAQVNGAAAADVTIASPIWANGAAPTDFTWDLLDADGVASLTGFSATSATGSSTQNGSSAGAITSISINAAGQIIATFGLGGKTMTVAQLALATFNNPQGLVKLGANRFGESELAGLPSIGVAGTGGRGTLVGSSLEQSNVDIAQEFTQMILAQRGYQANSKSIVVADELLVDSINLKR